MEESSIPGPIFQQNGPYGNWSARANHNIGRLGASGIVFVRRGDFYAFPVRIRWGESAYPSREV